MPYKDPEKRRQVKRASNKKWREHKIAEDEAAFREYTREAQRKTREKRTPEQRAEIYRKRREWMIRTGRMDPNAPIRKRGAPTKNPDFLTDMTDPRHGTLNGYNNLKCRCDRCRDANRVEHARYMAMRREIQREIDGAA